MKQHHPDLTAPARTPGSRRTLWLGSAVAGALLLGGGGLAKAAPGGVSADHRPATTSTAVHGKPADSGKPADKGKPTHAGKPSDAGKAKGKGAKAHGVVSVFTGTVSGVSNSAITITTAKGEERSFTIDPTTTFGPRSGAAGNPRKGKAGENGKAGEKGKKPATKPTGDHGPLAAAHTASDIRVGDRVRITASAAGLAITIADQAWLAGSSHTSAPQTPAPTSTEAPESPATEAPAPSM